jgi:hypothetical protein
MTAMVRLAMVLVAALLLPSCGEPPSLVGMYSIRLTEETLQARFPGTTAPAGAWNMEITEYDKIVVDAPDGGGFSLIIKSLKDDRVTLEPTGCRAPDGSPAGEAVYDIKRDGDAVSFVKVRDRCAEKDPEAPLLSIKPWKRVGKN